jgi:cytochrome b6-f complex iron-sulfur subunit
MTHSPTATKAPPAQLPSRLQGRRGILQAGLAVIAAGWGGWMAQGVLFPAASTETRPVEIPLADLPVGAARQISYEGKPALVQRTADGITALSMVCTHLGCLVQWQEARQQFYCPCHDGRFDRGGDVLSGPPPLPLERLPVKVLADRVVVGEML